MKAGPKLMAKRNAKPWNVVRFWKFFTPWTAGSYDCIILFYYKFEKI
jgi:hypothetical protein